MGAGLLKPNVIWTGEGEAPTAVNVGNVFIGELPDDKAQRAGFYHEQAHVLIGAFNGYKAYRGKEVSDGDSI